MRKTALLLAVCLLIGLVGCDSKNPSDVTVPSATVQVGEYSDIFSAKDLSGAYSDGKTIVLSENTTITSAGTYILQGSLENGQVIVEAGETDKVQLVLQNVSISCNGSAAIYIKSADKVFITLAEGSDNSLVSRGEFTPDGDTNVDAAVFAKCDLTFNGSGVLWVESEQGHGIVTKDDLKFAGGDYSVTAAGQGISGKDSVSVASGSFTIQSGADAIQSKHDENPEKGNIYIADGDFALTAGGDGMDASHTLAILGGNFQITTGEGAGEIIQSGGDFGGFPGWGGSGGSAVADETSRKGLKGGVGIALSGGVFIMDTQDDAIHSNDTVQITGGEFAIATGDDGVHADNTLLIENGTIRITQSYEGLEAASISITGGQIDLTASDDGLNAAGGNDGSGMKGPWGGDPFASDGSGIVITGGALLMDAGGDGIDSNGTITITGGIIFVDGPTNSGNGGMDYAESATVTGGTVFVLGASGMAQGFSNADGQGAIFGTFNTQAAGTLITVSDEKGNVLASYTSRKSFGSIAVSAPGMEKDGTYTLTIGGQSVSVTLDGYLYGSGGGMGGGGMGPGGNRPGGGGRPGGR